MKRSSGVIIVDAENVSKELFQYAFSYKNVKAHD